LYTHTQVAAAIFIDRGCAKGDPYVYLANGNMVKAFETLRSPEGMDYAAKVLSRIPGPLGEIFAAMHMPSVMLMLILRAVRNVDQ
jgi:hypothetical protein